MKVFSRATGETLLVGRCDIPEGTVDVYDVLLFGAKSMLMERFGIGEVVFYATTDDPKYRVEKGVLLIPGQDASLLPGWQPLSS